MDSALPEYLKQCKHIMLVFADYNSDTDYHLQCKLIVDHMGHQAFCHKDLIQ